MTKTTNRSFLLYLIALGFFLLSRIFHSIAVLDWICAAIGFVFLFLAIKKYFKK